MHDHLTIKDDGPIEKIQSEIDDSESSPPFYDIVTYPADYTLEGLVSKYQRSSIIVPGFERKFVWDIKQASRLIESFLLGLPVPAIFLYIEPKTNKQLLIDGQQRLLSIVYFFEGYFGEPINGQRTVFRLKGLNEKSPYYEKTYEDLKSTNEAAINQLNDSVLRAFIVKQVGPQGDSGSIYHIFERLNTGGTQLVGQEIRNCIYYGPFNDMLKGLNKNLSWRKIFGRNDEDKRQRDIEHIVRFLALYYKGEKYTKPMKNFLSNFMEENREGQVIDLASFQALFNNTVEAIITHLGDRPFHIRSGMNAAAFDSVSVAFAKHVGNIPGNISERYKALVHDSSFVSLVSSGTTDEGVVRGRLRKANEELFG
jgi:hypothetical protein